MPGIFGLDLPEVLRGLGWILGAVMFGKRQQHHGFRHQYRGFGKKLLIEFHSFVRFPACDRSNPAELQPGHRGKFLVAFVRTQLLQQLSRRRHSFPAFPGSTPGSISPIAPVACEDTALPTSPNFLEANPHTSSSRPRKSAHPAALVSPGVIDSLPGRSFMASSNALPKRAPSGARYRSSNRRSQSRQPAQ